MLQSQAYGGGYLKATDWNEQGIASKVLTIDSVGQAEFKNGDKQRTLKFKEIEEELGLNVTNWKCVAAITGQKDDDNWAGKQVEVFTTTTDFQGETTPCIRIRQPGSASIAPDTSDPFAEIDPVLGPVGGSRVSKFCADNGCSLQDMAGRVATVMGVPVTNPDPAMWPRASAPHLKLIMDQIKAEKAGERTISDEDIPFSPFPDCYPC